ncbi:MAG: Hsp20/alpha crystallin family protein [Candidatus Nanopelagicaceae bacterium]|nr:Hsp20/alpha crystallin family protein [Candidatus Nanopelagicaceae bacterium]
MATKELTIHKPSSVRTFLDFPRLEFPRMMDLFDDFLPFSQMKCNGEAHLIRIEESVNENEIIVRAEMPGVDPERDIEVSLDDGLLTIVGEKRVESKEADRSEFHYGSFSRSITLPHGVKEGDVHATYKDGILEVKVDIPKSIVKSKKVSIKRG